MTTITVPGARTGTYTIDPTRSCIGFAVRSMVPKVRGSFTEIEGSGYFDAANPARSTIDVRVGAASLDTGNSRRDAHLRSKDFLGVDEHPDMLFTAIDVEPVGSELYRVTGDLTVKGTTRPVTVEVRCIGTSVDDSGTPRIDFQGHAVLRRTEWNVRWNAILEGGGLLIANKVDVEFTVSAIRRDG